ncbi:MAG: lysylphosphatidylglycerol synthase transmembrane domain-containing protein [Ignavibacteriaceae bacterium]|nr:lysylphosphatidylglycerol synthase transmembrane domain-containing protein [Ignavibacteriaceae bacterium]
MVEVVKDIVNKNSFIQRYKTVIILFAKVIIAFGLLIYLINSVNLNEIISAIKNADVIFLSAAFALSILNIWLQFYKWKLTSNVILHEDRKSKIWLSLFYGFSAGVFTPARTGEYFGRALAFKDKSLLNVTLATLLDKLFLLIIVAFIGSLSGILFIHYYYNITYYITIALFLTVFILFYILILMIFNAEFWNNFLFKKISNSKRLKWLFEKVKHFHSLDKKYAAKMIFASFLLYTCFIIQFALLASAFSEQNNFPGYIWAANLVMFAKTIIPPVSFGELGIREGASVYFIKQVGGTASTGFNASIFLFLINLLLPSLLGLILLLKRNND